MPLTPPTANLVLATGLPDFDYPVPFAIRNAFIDVQIGRSVSLDDFYEERRVHSCPIGPPPGLDDCCEHDTLVEAHPVGLMMSAAAALWVPFSQPGPDTPMPVSIAGAIGAVGSPGGPTVGSAGHLSGTCKPCAFYHTKGCGNGANCSYCHLCPEGEKKRRQKVKLNMRRSVCGMNHR